MTKDLADELERLATKLHDEPDAARRIYRTAALSLWVENNLPQILSALRREASPSLTGEGEPVAWRWRAIFDDASRGGWFYETGPLSRHIHTRQGLEHQPLYTRPVAWPDREAVARIIGAACGVTWANGVVKYASTSEDDRPIDRFYRAADALLSVKAG